MPAKTHRDVSEHEYPPHCAIYVLKKNSKGKVMKYEGFVMRVLETKVQVRYYDENQTCDIKSFYPECIERRK